MRSAHRPRLFALGALALALGCSDQLPIAPEPNSEAEPELSSDTTPLNSAVLEASVIGGSVPVNLDMWTPESYSAVSGFGSGSWNVSADASSVIQTVNGQPTLFYGDFPAFKTEVQGVIRVETFSDDDFIGFVLGFRPGDSTNEDAEYLLVDWKKLTQPFDFGSPSCTPGSTAPAGLAVSRVFGVPTADELWGHTNFDAPGCSDLNNGVEELARGNTLGSTGWVTNVDYTFKFQFTATRLRVYVDDVLELDIEGTFGDGRLAFYNFSQAQVDYSAFTVAEFNNRPGAENDAYEVQEDVALQIEASNGVLANDADPDADALTAILVSGPTSGSLTLDPAGSFTYTPSANFHGSESLTYVASDGDLQSDPATVTITVNPVNDDPAADPGGPYSANEGSPVTLNLSGSDPDDEALTYFWDLDDGTSGSGTAPPSSHTYADDGSYTVSLTVENGSGGSDTRTTTATVANLAPDILSIAAPLDPLALGTEVVIKTSFSDPGSGDTHQATVDWGDGTASTLSAVTSPFQAGHTYGAAGVYAVSVTVTDDDGGADTERFEFVVLFDPSGGSVAGNGQIASPPGAYAPDPAASGPAGFGFSSRYKRGATVPDGRTRFRFRAGDLSFVADSYQWLVIAGARAQFKGTGQINRSGDYGFLLTAIDGELPGGGGVDRFRIKIWDRATGQVVYDNQMTAEDAADLTTETTELVKGKIRIRS